MKIIFSPSKEMKVGELNSPFSFSPKFKDESKEILNILKNLDKNQIEKIMKIKGELLEETYSNIINYDSRSDVKAINLYNGVAFKKLEIEQYTSKELEYFPLLNSLKSTVIILKLRVFLLIIFEYSLEAKFKSIFSLSCDRRLLI